MNRAEVRVRYVVGRQVEVRVIEQVEELEANLQIAALPTRDLRLLREGEVRVEVRRPAEAVADEAVGELLAYEATAGAVDPHSADQLLLPLAFAEGASVYTVSEMTEHLRTNVDTIRAFLDRPIRLDEPEGDRPGRVVVGN